MRSAAAAAAAAVVAGAFMVVTVRLEARLAGAMARAEAAAVLAVFIRMVRCLAQAVLVCRLSAQAESSCGVLCCVIATGSQMLKLYSKSKYAPICIAIDPLPC